MRRTAALILVIISAGLVFPLPVCEHVIWVDRVSASQKYQTVWLGIFHATPVVNPALLDQRLRRMGFRWDYQWKYIAGTQYNLFGSAVSFACGMAPAVYHLPANDPEYVDNLSSRELLEFARTMRSGSDAEKKAAVDAAYKKYVDTFDKRSDSPAAPAERNCL